MSRCFNFVNNPLIYDFITFIGFVFTTLGRKLRSRKGSGIADQILQNAPEFCEIKIICDGKEVMIDRMVGFPTPCGDDDDNAKSMRLQDQSNNDLFACMCFKSPRVM